MLQHESAAIKSLEQIEQQGSAADRSAKSRDYRLHGPSADAALAAGLANAKWFSPAVPRKALAQLMARQDGPAIRDTALWLGVLLLSGAAMVMLWGSWWAVIPTLVYGVFYGSAADSRWHECGHGTAFKTRWMNEWVYQLGSFMMLRNPVAWCWSHKRHHLDTIIVGRDAEIAAQRPIRLHQHVLNLFGIFPAIGYARSLARNVLGRVDADEASYIPEEERPAVYRAARIHLAIFAGVAATCLWTGSILPAMLVGLPSFYGAWLGSIHGLSQHAGLMDDVLDHRLNSRTIHMTRFNRFIYWNMNYHLEHHMFPTVPFHALPKLHELVKDECPPPYPGLIAAYREIIPALWRQRTDPDYAVVRPLPEPSTDAGREKP